MPNLLICTTSAAQAFGTRIKTRLLQINLSNIQTKQTPESKILFTVKQKTQKPQTYCLEQNTNMR